MDRRRDQDRHQDRHRALRARCRRTFDDLDEIGDALADGSISLTRAGVLARATGASDDEQRELLDAAAAQLSHDEGAAWSQMPQRHARCVATPGSHG